MLPGALVRNSSLEYRCQWTYLQVEPSGSLFTAACKPGQVLRIPISHGEGNYFADQSTLEELEERGQVVLRYSTPKGERSPDSNPNGSLNDIAGIVNEAGNVLGMMPHPERCCEDIMGGTDGRLIFESIIGRREDR